MKNKRYLISGVVGFFVAALFVIQLLAAENSSIQRNEYLTIRWAGREHTHVIRPNGEVQFLGPLFAQARRPDRADERAFLMSIAMNAVAKEGYELAGVTSDEIVMKREITR